MKMKGYELVSERNETRKKTLCNIQGEWYLHAMIASTVFATVFIFSQLLAVLVGIIFFIRLYNELPDNKESVISQIWVK